MSEFREIELTPLKYRLSSLLVAATLMLTSPMALAGKFNWGAAAAGAVAGGAQAASESLDREIQVEQQKKLIEYQYQLERQRIEQQAAAEQQRQQRAEEQARKSAEEAKRNALSTGTGFFVTASGYLITNNHVISDKNTYAVRDSKGRYYRANLIARDQSHDLALLKVDGRFPSLKIGNSDSVSKGQRVIAVGYPQVSIQGNESKVTDGIINSLSGIRNDDDWFQISVPIQAGNSGGPLVSESGIVYGVVVATLSASKLLASTGNLPQNVNYAIKSNLALDFLAREGIKNVPTISGKANIAAVDNASVLIIAKNGPIDVVYQSAQPDRAAEIRVAELTAATERARQIEETKRARESAAAEKLRLAEESKQAKLAADEEAGRLRKAALVEKMRLAEETKKANQVAAAEKQRLAEDARKATLAKEKEAQEVRKLTAVHPDWLSLIKTEQFAYWRDHVIHNGKELMKSEDSDFIIRHLTQFKEWKQITEQKEARL